jgi:hypothetical protein
VLAYRLGCIGAPLVTQQSTTQKLPLLLKATILIVAAMFLGYCIYWLVQGVIWGCTVTFLITHINQIPLLHSAGNGELLALFIQESCSVANSFILMICGAFAFQSAIYYIKSDHKYIQALRRSLVLLAVFSILLVPASVHHLLGIVYGWSMVELGVGLSYLIQALLIVPPLLVLSQKMRKPKNVDAIKKWAYIAAPAYVFALYIKYLLLWLDTLVPMGPKEASLAANVGGINSVVTLLVGGLMTAAACYALWSKKPVGMRLAGVTVIVVGGFFVVDSLVAVFVPVYAWFWYLTDFWMVSLPVLGAAILWISRKSA